MWNESWTTNATGQTTFTVYFGVPMNQPPPPTCHVCNGAAGLHDEVGRAWCRPCLDEHNRQLAVKDAANWLSGAFHAVKREQRARLYKMLSAAFHPDQGGDPDLMVALNAVREKFPS